MNSGLNDRESGPDDDQFASLQAQLSELAQTAGRYNADASSTAINPVRPVRARGRSAVNRWPLRSVTISLFAILGIGVWWWSSHAATVKALPQPAPALQMATEEQPRVPAHSSEFAPQLQSITRDLATLRDAIEQLKAGQEQSVRDNENVARQLKASQEQMARSDQSIVEQLRASQDQTARNIGDLAERLRTTQAQISPESDALSERLKATEEQVRRIIGTRSAPTPRVQPPAAPRQPSANTTPKLAVAPASKGAAQPQAKKPQRSSAAPPTPAR